MSDMRVGELGVVTWGGWFLKGEIVTLHSLGNFQRSSRWTTSEGRTMYDTGNTVTPIREFFKTPLRPTEKEVKIFNLLYGTTITTEQITSIIQKESNNV